LFIKTQVEMTLNWRGLTPYDSSKEAVMGGNDLKLEGINTL